jgi:hypothetical protein
MRLVIKILFWLIAIVTGIVLLMLLPSPQPDASKPWEVSMMEDGNPKVLSIHLGSTTYETAQKLFNVYGETGLFEDPDGRTSVEAFFNSVNLGGLSAKVVLNLAVEEDLRTEMKTRAVSSQLQPSDARRYDLSEQDKLILAEAPISSLTYIPSVSLSQEMVASRFGETEEIEQIAGSGSDKPITLWHYPRLKLTVQFQTGSKTILTYQAEAA